MRERSATDHRKYRQPTTKFANLTQTLQGPPHRSPRIHAGGVALTPRLPSLEPITQPAHVPVPYLHCLDDAQLKAHDGAVVQVDRLLDAQLVLHGLALGCGARSMPHIGRAPAAHQAERRGGQGSRGERVSVPSPPKCAHRAQRRRCMAHPANAMFRAFAAVCL